MSTPLGSSAPLFQLSRFCNVLFSPFASFLSIFEAMIYQWLFQPITVTRAQILLALFIILVLVACAFIWMYYAFYLAAIESNMDSIITN